MKSVKQIMNQTLKTNALVNTGSYYFTQNNKVIRFSDHKANWVNFANNNSEVEEILLVQVTESEENFDKYVEEIEKNTGCEIFLITYTSDEDIEVVTKMIERFLNN